MSDENASDTALIEVEAKPKAAKRSRAAAPAAKKAAARKPRVARAAKTADSAPPAAGHGAVAETGGSEPQSGTANVEAVVEQIVVSEPASVETRVPLDSPSAPSTPEPVAPPQGVPANEGASSNGSVTSTNGRPGPDDGASEGTPPSAQPGAPGGQQVPTGEPGGRHRERRGRMSWRERRRERQLLRQQQAAQQGQAQGQPAEGQTGDQQGPESPPERLLGPPETVEGILELSPKGYGFLRQRDRGYAQTPNDAFVSPEFIRKYGLREGMEIKGESRRGHRGPQVTEIAEVNRRAPDAMRDLPLFEELKAINANKRILFETVPTRLTTRVIDLVTPVGRGQRGLIVAPPRAGKTTLLQHIAEAVTQLHPQLHLMILLVDERPEEVTEFKRILPRAEIFASSNDMDVKSHTRIAQFAIERAKRLCECGEHVFILMDSITRMARAFNNAKQGGATMSGGVGVGALEIPRRLFAAARNTRAAGSITILATALIETGSRMDDLIFQEFKGTGNMELVLDRKIAEQYVFPAVNVLKSGTRREELLIPAFQLEKIHMLRRGLAGHKPIEAIMRVVSLLERYPNNNQMLVELPSK
ncbi:MAG: transcription termination factor Rho [Verrucomicrobiaceae bacterium]|nr:transcription termination factor Rho [Verrucomicrobiaceae bacterium]